MVSAVPCTIVLVSLLAVVHLSKITGAEQDGSIRCITRGTGLPPRCVKERDPLFVPVLRLRAPLPLVASFLEL
jgi:hypothetical protein